jgi:aspartate-semialdehyde dehydrogenase
MTGAPRVAVIGATGAVGQELLRVLAERQTPVGELRLFASEESEGIALDFADSEPRCERVEPGRVASCDVVFVAAPGQLEPLLPTLREHGTRVVDLSGLFELDVEVPLYVSGAPVSGPFVAIPRGVAAALIAALVPVAREARLERLTVTTLESASGAGRRGLDELQAQTVQVLSAMDGGEPEVGMVFPRLLAFDCLPVVGELDDSDETFEERRLRHVLRRALAAPELAVEVTRIRVPIFTGALASVHVQLEKPLASARVRELWRDTPALRLLDDSALPTPRSALAHDDIEVGRIRTDSIEPLLAFVVALDTLRRGAALAAVEAAELLLAE